jgi:hypothetical protein
MEDEPFDQILKDTNDKIICNNEKMEVVYPNQKNDKIRPITIEYIAIDKLSHKTKFLGDCYLISHRPKIEHFKSKKINSIHLYLADQETDSVIKKLKTEFDVLLKGNNISAENCTDVKDTYFAQKKCDKDNIQLSKNGKNVPVYWHKRLPNDDNFILPNSLVIFNAHHTGGQFRFNNNKVVNFTGNIGNIDSPNYILNACGNPGVKTIDEVVVNAKYRNLFFANKKITPETAAKYMFCSVNEFLSIPKGCIPMSTWMINVKQCMGDLLGKDRYKTLAYHFIGLMEDQLCIN